MELFFLALSAGAYLIAAASFVSYFMVKREQPPRVAAIVLAVAFALHAVALGARGVNTGIVFVSSFHDQLSVLGWLIVGLYLILQLRYPLAVLGALVSPLVFLLTVSAYMVHAGVRTLPPTLQSAWLPAHVAPAFLGYAVFAVAFCISLIYLLQERQLKGKRRSGMFRRLPSLETLDELNHRFVVCGFTLFTIGILTGSLLAKAMWGAFWSWEPVQVFSMLTWLLYATLLHARSVGWRGRKAAALTIIGFALLVVSFVGVNLGRHSATFG